MKTRRTAAGHNGERGLVITLVAVFLLFAVGAMAVLAIDVATFYTARSEAQRAADTTALSAARALANSGMTSNPADTDLAANAEQIATNLALQVATSNEVGGRNLVGAVNCANEVCISFNDGDGTFGTNPHVTVTITRSDLPTFFARIFGRNLVTVQATAMAEAYNPSGTNADAAVTTPVAPICVKPWVLPNIDPTSTSTPPAAIFNPATGAIQNPSLLGWKDATPLFKANCQGPPGQGPRCLPSWPVPSPWQFYPGTYSGGTPSFPPPTQALPSCSFGTPTAYQETVAGCVTTPIACNSTVTLDQSDSYPHYRHDTAQAVNCLTHSDNDQGDQVAVVPPGKSFQFLAGADNPIPGLAGKNVLVSDSVVTVPVGNITTTNPLGPTQTSVQVIGFVQLFMNYDGKNTNPGPPASPIKTAIVNLVGCGTGATGTPIYGNGPSAVAVRLIHQ